MLSTEREEKYKNCNLYTTITRNTNGETITTTNNATKNISNDLYEQIVSDDDEYNDEGCCDDVGDENMKNGNNNDDNDIDDDEDDDEDNIIITLDSEQERINAIINANPYNVKNYTNVTYKQQQPVTMRLSQQEKLDLYLKRYSKNVYKIKDEDVELNNEIDNLINLTINLRHDKVIAAYVRNVILLIPNTKALSSRLIEHIWRIPLPYELSKFPNMKLYNENLQKASDFTTRRNGTIAFFTPFYKKLQRQDKTYSSINDTILYSLPKHVNSAMHLFLDFTICIVKNGEIVDYAIHGFKSNIVECVNKHKPEKIFYLANENDSIDVFMKYKYQPFYEVFDKRLVRIQLNIKEMNRCNVISFCERKQSFDSFCNCLKTIYTYFKSSSLKYNLTPNVRFVQHIKDYNNLDIVHSSRTTRYNFMKKYTNSYRFHPYNNILCNYKMMRKKKTYML